jgi:hypothetical protein
MGNFFKTDSERELWIKLNAEHIQYGEKVINNMDKELGDVDKPYSPMWVSKNQLEYDEANKDAPRFSLEELLTESPMELVRLTRERNKDTIKKLFEGFKLINPLDNDY